MDASTTEKCDFCRTKFDGPYSKKKARRHFLEKHAAGLRRTRELLPRPPSARMWTTHRLVSSSEIVQPEGRGAERCDLSTDMSIPMEINTIVVIDDSPPPSVVGKEENEDEVNTWTEENASNPPPERMDSTPTVDDGIILRRILRNLEDVDLTPLENGRTTASSPVKQPMQTQTGDGRLVDRGTSPILMPFNGRMDSVSQSGMVEPRSGLMIQQMTPIILWASRLPSFPNWTRFREEVSQKFPSCSLYDAEEIHLQMQPWFIRPMAAASVCRLPAVVPAVAAVAPTDDMFAVGDWIHFNSAPASPDEWMSVLDGHGEHSDDTDGLHTPSLEYSPISS